MNIFADLRARIIDAIQQLQLETVDGSAADFTKLSTEPPRDPSHGDIATNAAMVLAKSVGENPRTLAERIGGILEQDEDIVSVTVAGPGFINLKLSDTFWISHLSAILDAGERYGRSNAGAGRKINVEYVSANPTGPMHVGHCRGAVVGDALANLLDFAGAEVTKEYYVNDAGVQIGVLSRSVWLRYLEALGEDVGEIPEGLYPGDYLVPVGKSLADEFGKSLKDKSESEALGIIADRTIDAMMEMIRKDLGALNVNHDVFFSERSLHAENAAAISGAIAALQKAGHVYQGKLPPPKGQKPDDDWEDREQLLFRSTEVGDDMDRPLQKSDGSYTYFASDVAYLKDKLDRGFDQSIFVLGADHSGYVKRLEALNKALSAGKSQLTVILCNLVKLFRDGEPVRMSKRAGEFVTLRDVVDEVGRDPVRFMMLYRKNMEPLDFDFAKVTEQSKDNPVFYVQYASARCHSVFRQAEDQLGLKPEVAEMKDNLHLLTDAAEISLIQKLAEYPRLIDAAAQTLEPHRIAFYLYDLASVFHGHWNRGNETVDLRFVKVNNSQLTKARLGLVQAVSHVLTSGLGMIGVDAPQEMR